MEYYCTTTKFDASSALTYFYQHPTKGHQLCIATFAPPGQDAYSLGANRIIPADLENLSGFNLQTMARDLASQMQEKIEMMRRFSLSNAVGLHTMEHFYGGKCVGLPQVGARAGEPGYADYLQFQIDCFRDYEQRTKNKIITGQDLGHGIVDSTTDSLQFMEMQFNGIISTDTSFITGLGVFHLTQGMLAAIGKPLGIGSRIGVIGAGKVGLHIIHMRHDFECEFVALESNPKQRQLAKDAGVDRVYEPAQAQAFYAEPVDAVLANANCGSFHQKAINWILANPHLRILTGAENLAMPNTADEQRLRTRGRYYAPTEIAGLMGALAAAAEYTARIKNKHFTHESMIGVAERLRHVGEKSTEWMLKHPNLDFNQASRQAFAQG